MTLQELMGVLARKVPKPTIEKVTKAVEAEPQLRKGWNYYLKNRGPAAKAKEFLDYFSRLPKFKELMQKLQDDAGFNKTYADVMRTDDAGRVLKAGLEAGAGPLDRTGIARQATAEARSSGENHAPPVAGGGAHAIGLAAGPGGGRGANPAGGASPYGSDEAGSRIAGANPSGPSGGGATAANLGGGEIPGGTFGSDSAAPSGRQAEANAGNRDAGGGGHDAGGLRKLKAYDTNGANFGATTFDFHSYQQAFLTFLDGIDGSGVKRAQIECAMGWPPGKTANGKPYTCPPHLTSLGPDGKGDDISGACYETGLYDICLAFCNQDPKHCGGGLDTYWNACRNSRGHTTSANGDVACIKSCTRNEAVDTRVTQDNAACMATIDAGTWDADCRSGALACKYCLSSQDCNPRRCPDSLGTCYEHGQLSGGTPQQIVAANPVAAADQKPTSACPASMPAATCTSYQTFLETTGCDPEKTNCVASYDVAKLTGQDSGSGSGTSGGTGSDGGSATPSIPPPGSAGNTQPVNHCFGQSASAVGCGVDWGVGTLNTVSNIGKALCGDACGALGALVTLPLTGLAIAGGAVVGGLSKAANVIGGVLGIGGPN
ncbi:MAG: hypothetical protein NTX64_15240 [Elusimicrobia bacterium]|nr:hypothetical protein [Elusimicrobiota bacterium]